MRRYVSATEFAEIVDKSPRTVVNWIKNGWIPRAKKVGNTYRIPRGEITRYHEADEYPFK